MLNFGNKEFRNLQEQVLKNAQDIEILKEKPNLSISIVEELPEVGQEGILYLVPSSDPELENAYDEYVWLPESESFEMVGSTAIDLSNMVTTDTDQTITGEKTFTSDVNVQSDINLSGELILGTGMSVKNHAPGSDNYLDLIQGGSNRMAIGSAIYSYVDLLPGANGSKNLGSSSMRWNNLYLYGNAAIDFGVQATITKDSSNRINLNNGGVTRIKVGGVDSTYCVANWNPDTDGTYSLGKDNMRWSVVNATKLQNEYSSLTLKGKYNITCDGYVVPATNNQYTLGNSNAIWLNTFTTKITDGTNEIAVADIAKKPDYANPNVFESGTLDANGEGVIDMTETGMPEDGLYMFTYGNAQCFIALTSTMIQNATLSPIRCPCPLLYNGTGYPGNLRIDRSADILTLKVAAPNVGVVQPSGFQWQLIKVM